MDKTKTETKYMAFLSPIHIKKQNILQTNISINKIEQITFKHKVLINLTFKHLLKYFEQCKYSQSLQCFVNYNDDSIVKM